MRRATTWARGSRVTYVISIHALLAESDAGAIGQLQCILDFYPRSPCGERPIHIRTCQYFFNFYPRSPCGERHSRNANLRRHRNFYPRSPCGERQSDCGQYCTRARISIHALLAESDIVYAQILANTMLFLSTLSLRRATLVDLVSIVTNKDFYPRSPCGERPPPGRKKPPAGDFYPRSPCGERRRRM